MPAVLNVLFLAVVCVVLYGLFLGAWVAALYLFRLRRKPLLSLMSLPVFVALLVGYSWHQTRPSKVFERSFGFAPPADVTALRSYQFVLGDSGVVYLRFRASPATVQRIVARGLRPVGTAVDGPASTNATPPDWWQPPPTTQAAYVGNFGGRNFASEEEYVVYDPATGEVYFRFVGID